MAPRPRASTSRRPTSSPSPGRWTELGIDYVEGGWPGRQPHRRRRVRRTPVAQDNARLVAFGMTRRAGRSAENDPGLAGRAGTARPRRLPVRQGLGFPRRRGARRTARRERRAMIAESVATTRPSRKAEVMFDAEHFFDGYKANPGLCAGLPQGGPRRRRPLGRAVRHQRRHAAGRDRAHRRRGRRGDPGQPSGHPLPQRHRERGRRLAGRAQGRRAPGPGHPERPGRALRQRQPGLADPLAGAQDGLRDRHRPRPGSSS